ncbi:D-alanyl-D-alanine carboxypeptidase/D-alanyl-D-alanine-endopeptidase [Pelomyxa schiedti]|nr:D-alanyl-D-alanine carboxypeptidase/D-alanyl-D-alanine-endopeptidase [Pelomyxa schiedti]
MANGLALGLVACVVIVGVASLCYDELPAAIDEIFDDCGAECDRERWGVLAQIAGPTTLYSLDADNYFVPASNNKLLTCGALWSSVGGDFAYRTPLYYSPDEQALCLVGSGDPTITTEALQSMTSFVASQGISPVKLKVDPSIFAPYAYFFSWEWEDMSADYGALPVSLIVNGNTIEIKVIGGDTEGSPAQVFFTDSAEENLTEVVNLVQTVGYSHAVPLGVWGSYKLGTNILQIVGFVEPRTTHVIAVSALPPEEHFLGLLSNLMKQSGVSITGQELEACNPDGNPSWIKLYDIVSVPLATIMNDTLQNSVNINAECFLNTYGAMYAPNSSATDAVKSKLETLSVDPSGFHQTDGSGLSKNNLVSPESLAQLLWALSKDQEFISMLPVAGVSGTLQDRFIGTPAEGVVHAKTGTVTGVSALSGYVIGGGDGDGEMVVFSVIVNHSARTTDEQHETMDQIVVLFAEMVPC